LEERAQEIVTLGQALNPPFPIAVTLSGMVTEIRLLQSLNAYSPIVVTLSGMVMEVRLLHS
jgi:hypothetical protein